MIGRKPGLRQLAFEFDVGESLYSPTPPQKHMRRPLPRHAFLALIPQRPHINTVQKMLARTEQDRSHSQMQFVDQGRA